MKLVVKTLTGGRVQDCGWSIRLTGVSWREDDGKSFVDDILIGVPGI
jgi:hypothetical protein